MIYFSIIIPVKEINTYIRENIQYIKKIKEDWELILVPNNASIDEWLDNRIRIIPSGRLGPAEKRDLAAKEAAGNVLVFLDDDSYPSENLLSIAKAHFENKSVVAIGGPGITPPTDSFLQKVSGAVFLSKFSGGSPERYVPNGPVRDVDDWPSVNLMVRRDDFLKIGGFNTKYWPGEDTKLCLALKEKTKKRILYVPELIVWHHRREGIKAHLKQIGAYGLHRGYFAKKFQKNSFRLKYFLPSIFFILALLSVAIIIFNQIFLIFSLLFWAIYLLVLIKIWIDIVRYEKKSVASYALFYIPLTHLYYGFMFIIGLFRKELISKLR
jgi:GT2 family glycosyltransferase